MTTAVAKTGSVAVATAAPLRVKMSWMPNTCSSHPPIGPRLPSNSNNT